ncbi:hypothetical protein ACQCU1_03225 [Sutcliffiella horikoshii]|uniref:hypothetical protein n=1 Tax=Sutcliffiella horikoshii TaxID=79883 RepID=UPI003CF50491
MERVCAIFQSYSTNMNSSITENFDTFTLSINLSHLTKQLSVDDIENLVSNFNPRDNLIIDVKIDLIDPFTLNIKENDILQDQIENINTQIGVDSDLCIEISVDKVLINNTRSIYEITHFLSYLESLKLVYLLNNFNAILDLHAYNVFEVQNNDNKVYFKSPLFIIASRNSELTQMNIDESVRSTILKSRAVNTNPQLLAKYKFIPNDFDSDSPYEIPLFKKIKVVLSATYLANTSNVEKNNYLRLTIIGHNHVEVLNDYKLLDISRANVFFEIYKWVYLSGETNDKLSLSRNIIARYFGNIKDQWNLPKETLNSIQSAHAIYLKENVEKYIDLKNKVAELTTELSVKNKELTQFFSSSFKNNNLTLLTYFISIFIFNSLSSNSNSKIFSEEKYYLSMVFLLLSAVYLLITIRQLKRDIQVHIRYFFSIKKIYRGLFDQDELNKLFSKRHLTYTLLHVKKTGNIYSSLWLLEIISLTFVSIYLTFFI